MCSVSTFSYLLFYALFTVLINAQCTNPTIRREWRTLDRDERAAWISAVKCLAASPNNPDLVATIHQTGMFLPFHRWFVHSVEKAMVEKCGFSGRFPYWNWTIDAPDFYESSYGVGGWGDPDKDYKVQDGAFARFALKYPSYHPMHHQYTAQPFAAFAASSPTFAQDLAGTRPATTEDCIPGNKWSPNSPLFFLHHVMIGKIWSDWQNLNETSTTAFAGGSVQAFDNTTYLAEYPTGAPPMLNTSSDIYTHNMFPGVTIGDVLNHTARYLCYVYE
ncbi:Di-copper centre-containing protein [Lentinula aciculospora]|uniref:Di-copper centre-containing protein n=1 Tax=Lentinula aciculospora TaxID=153920 RepID=A0A9W9ADI1_9AGAR|nr:Di-copper centre-containing protein [Lentinula aciculospora]